MPRLRIRGFTLIELMIVLIVIGVLAAIALPAYLSQIQRSNRSAAQQYMQDLANREEQYRLDARSYTTSKSTLGWATDPSTVSAYYGVAVTTTGNDCNATALVAPAYAINATVNAGTAQTSDGSLCLDSLGQKTPTAKW